MLKLRSILDEIMSIGAEIDAISEQVPYSDLETKKSYNCYKLPTQTENLQRRINAHNSSKTA